MTWAPIPLDAVLLDVILLLMPPVLKHAQTFAPQLLANMKLLRAEVSPLHL